MAMVLGTNDDWKEFVREVIIVTSIRMRCKYIRSERKKTMGDFKKGTKFQVYSLVLKSRKLS